MSDRTEPHLKEGEQTSIYIYYVLGVLMLAYMISFVDRMILSLVVDPIRHDLALTETQFSLLIGFAFVLFYACLGLPLGRLADSRSRRNIVAIGMTIWSLATAACGLAQSFWGLFSARLAVGAGEASLIPASFSMVPDFVPSHRRGIAMAILAIGPSIGGGLAMLLGGLVVDWATAAKPILPIIGQVAPWKIAFIAAGIPGLLVALLLVSTVKEPKRRIEPHMVDALPPFREVTAYLVQHGRLYGLVMFGFAGLVTTSYSLMTWGPTYFMRLHGLTPSEVGGLFALSYGLAGAVSVLCGGLINDRLVRAGYPHAAIKIVAWAALPPVPLYILAYLSSDTRLCEGTFILATFLSCGYGGLQGVAIQSITPSRMRGQISALYLLVVNLVGLGVAPTVTAMLGQYLFGGAMGIGKALAVTTGSALVAAATLLFLAQQAASVRAKALAG